MNRTEINLATGEQITIQQKACRDDSGAVHILDADVETPWIELTEAEFAAHKLAISTLTKDQRIAALLSARGLNMDSEWQLSGIIAGMQAAASTQGKTEAQLYASNPGYKNAKDLFLAVAAIRAAP